MDNNTEVQQHIALGNMYEDRGSYDKAEVEYLQAIDLIGSDDNGRLGPLYINLGTNAEYAGRDTDAASYFKKAIELLKNERGDGLLQCAHAHYNLAKLLLRYDDPEAPVIAERAKELYARYPYTTPADRADAAVLRTLTATYIEKSATEAMLHETWNLIRHVDAGALNRYFLIDFLPNYLLFYHQVRPQDYEALRNEIHSWATPEIWEVVKELLAKKVERE